MLKARFTVREPIFFDRSRLYHLVNHIDPNMVYDVTPWFPPAGIRAQQLLSCTPFLDRPAGGFPACLHQGGPCAADANISDIGGLLPIALCGRISL